jgi:glycerol kinase
MAPIQRVQCRQTTIVPQAEQAVIRLKYEKWKRFIEKSTAFSEG